MALKIAVMFMGKPGSGKGTQAEILVKQYNLTHFNTGEVIRHRLANPKNDEDAREKEIYESGKLNTFEWVANLVLEKAHEYAKAGHGIVFSGSPRSLYEAERLIPQLLADYGEKKVIAILVDIDDRLAVERNSGRLTCDKCGLTMTVLAPDLEKMTDGVFPKCGGRLIQRAIDTAEKIVEKRLPDYYQNTVPAIEYIKKQGILREVDGRKTIEEARQEIAKIVEPIVKQ